MSFSLTPKQREANLLLASDARHILLRGGARSGKTFILTRAMAVRSLKCAEARGVILRFRFNHVKTSILYDTWPKMMNLCFPELSPVTDWWINKSDWFIQFKNGSEVWFGGLDDKDRSEKILGQEYSTIYLNEASQISYHAALMARTRLAQKTNLALKFYVDTNPSSTGHWTYHNFIKGVDAITKKPLKYRNVFKEMLINPTDNRGNIPQETLDELEALPPAQRARFWEGLYQNLNSNALWSHELIEKTRVDNIKENDLERIVVAVDPSGAGSDKDISSDEIGIVVAAKHKNGDYYVLDDLTFLGGPSQWGKVAVDAYYKYGANAIVGESNFGGAMVEHVIQSYDDEVNFKLVRASRGKHVRAEPISTLFHNADRKRPAGAHMVGQMSELEDQMIEMTATGFIGSNSPDRLDAMVWAISELMKPTPQVGVSSIANDG